MSKINKMDSSDDAKENNDNIDCDSGFIASAPINLEIESDNKDDRSIEQKKQQKQQKSPTDHGKEITVDDFDSGILVSTELSSKISKIKIEDQEEVDGEKNEVERSQQQSAPQNQLQPWEIFYQQTKEGGDTQLHFACVDGLEKVVAALIRLAPHSCLFNIQNNDCQTAMHLAALSSKPKIIRMLLIAGADPMIRDRNGNNPLHLSSEAGDLQCVKALTTPISKSEIQEAHRIYGHRSLDKSISYLRKPPQLPFDLEIRNYDGERCVHLAAMGGHIDVLRQLVQFGADINSKEGKSGRTPLHIAIEAANDLVLSFLLEECKNTLNIEAITYGGLTAYQFASVLKNAAFQNNLKLRGAEPLTPPDTDDDSDIEDVDVPVQFTNFI